MKTKVLIGVLLFLIVVNLATIGTYIYLRYTQNDQVDRSMFSPGNRMPPPGPGGNDPMALLNKEQREKLFTLIHSFQEETYDLRSRIRTLEDETFKLLQQDPVPREQVDAKLKEISAVRLVLSRKASEKLIEAKAFLSAEQQERLYGAITQARPDFPGPPPRRGMPPSPPFDRDHRFRHDDPGSKRN